MPSATGAQQVAGNSRHWGVRLCVGTWAEGGDQMGKNVFEMIREYGGSGKIFDVDFRNVSSPLPRFNETFLDDRISEHISGDEGPPTGPVQWPDGAGPHTRPGRRSRSRPRRFGICIGYMRALLRAANEEVG